MGTVLRAALAAAVLVVTSVAAIADDWVAVRLRGVVLQLVDGEWQKLQRGDVVPDSRVIRTLRNGNVEFQRGEEHVALGSDTQIQIYDKARSKPFTTVKQYFGTVTVEAEVRKVQHFAVQTQYLAAVVKGTKFTVTSGDDGASVEVLRGSVFVEDRASKNDVTITAGQSASVGEGGGAPVVAEEHSLPGLLPSADTSKLADEATGDTPKGKSDNSDDDDHSGRGKSGDDDNDHHGKSGKNDNNSGKGKQDDDED